MIGISPLGIKCLCLNIDNVNFNSSEKLNKAHALYVSNLIDRKEFVSATAGCELNGFISCDKSRNWVGVHYHTNLKEAIKVKLGRKIGEHNGMSASGHSLTIGVCAEQHAANNVLKDAFPNENTNYDVAKLTFTKAVRPKGKKVIEPCVNCNTIFSK